MLAYSAMKEHGELHARIFGVEATDQFLFGFGQIKWRAIGFRDGRDEVAEESENLRQRAGK